MAALGTVIGMTPGELRAAFVTASVRAHLPAHHAATVLERLEPVTEGIDLDVVALLEEVSGSSPASSLQTSTRVYSYAAPMLGLVLCSLALELLREGLWAELPASVRPYATLISVDVHLALANSDTWRSSIAALSEVIAEHGSQMDEAWAETVRVLSREWSGTIAELAEAAVKLTSGR